MSSFESPTGLTAPFVETLRQIAAVRVRGSHRRAIEIATLLLNRRPPAELEASIRIERARSSMAEGDWSQAESDLCHALAQRDSAEVRALLGECLLAQDRSAEAAVTIEPALLSDDRLPRRWALYARSLSAAGRHEEACAAAETAHDGDPRNLPMRLRVLAVAGHHAELISLAQCGLERTPRDADLWTLVGVSLDALGNSKDAAIAFRRAVELDPDRVDANCGLGMALLRLGDYAAGFRQNEYRQKEAGRCHRLGVAPWRGEALLGKHLVVHAEQGFGDTIQFARFLPLVRASAAHTTFIAPVRLVRLLRSNAALGEIRTGHPGFGLGGYQTLVMSLPHHLGLGDEITAAPVPFLFPEADLVDGWRARLPAGPKVALAWQGNPNYAGDPWRSMPFREFEPLIERYRTRVTFFSLQKNAGREQLMSSGAQIHIVDLGDHIDRDGDAFIDTLAILSQIDLLITTDNGLAHVAGCGGIRTWLLLGKAPDWRWGLDGISTRWYPSMRLYRQVSSGDWSGVIDTVCDELGSLLNV